MTGKSVIQLALKLNTTIHPNKMNSFVDTIENNNVRRIIMAPITGANYAECIKQDDEGNTIIYYSAPNTNNNMHVNMNGNVIEARAILMYENKDGDHMRSWMLLVGEFEPQVIADIPENQRPAWGGGFRAIGIKFIANNANILVGGIDEPNMAILQYLLDNKAGNVPWVGVNGVTIQARTGLPWVGVEPGV
jgi:hypothetical protein